MLDSSFVLIKTSFPDRSSAESVAKQLVTTSRVACAQLLGPIESYFFWDGATQHEEEFLLLLKTVSDQQQSTLSFIQETHPYDTPEIVVLPIIDGSPDYLEWIKHRTWGT